MVEFASGHEMQHQVNADPLKSLTTAIKENIKPRAKMQFYLNWDSMWLRYSQDWDAHVSKRSEGIGTACG